MEYRLLDPYPQTQVPCVWHVYSLRNEGRELVYGCVPNGGIGISIILSGDCYLQQGTSWEQQPPMFVYGLVRQVQWHKISANYRELTLVFRPYHLQQFLKARLSDLPQNAATSVYELFERHAIGQLYERLSVATTDPAVQQAVAEFLQACLQRELLDKRMAQAHSLIYEHKLRQVQLIADELGITPTRLRDLFREHYGLSPKELIRIRRINEAFRVREHREPSLTSLAYRLDYFDQAHFIHDFRAATGISPKQYFRNEQLSFDFYNFGRWVQDSFVQKDEQGVFPPGAYQLGQH